MWEGQYAGFHRSLARKHGQLMTEVSVSPLRKKTNPKKPARKWRASSLSGISKTLL